MPSRTQWQRAINISGYALELDPELTPFEDSGFLPCMLTQSPSGFEIYYESAAELIDRYPILQDTIGKRDWCITFRWGSDMAECACVLIASLALFDVADAVVYYPDDSLLYDRETLKDDIEACMNEQ